MARAFLIIIDSFGIGGAPDAAAFGDEGSDTLGHIAEHCAAGKADVANLRNGPLALPNMVRLGLGCAAELSTGKIPPGLEDVAEATGAYGFASEVSAGKDTPSGHWELAGLPVTFDWGYFPVTSPCFPVAIIEELMQKCNLPGILGDCHASGSLIIQELGLEHIASGKPIIYTSADSVFQIAAHEDHFGLERLYEVCAIAKEILEPLNICRVIARPFTGDAPENFVRTANRKDLTTPPHQPTLLDLLSAAGHDVVSIGKIADIFAHKGISHKLKAATTDGLVDHTISQVQTARASTFVFTNLVDFDSLYGHRRDVAGYAAALEALDKRIPEIEACLRLDDIAILSADHGCDPTWTGTDHTRENVPVLMFGPGIKGVNIGGRESFADVGQTIADHLGIAALSHGTSFLKETNP